MQSFHGSGCTVAGFHGEVIRRAAEYIVIFLLFKEKDRTRVKLCSIGIFFCRTTERWMCCGLNKHIGYSHSNSSLNMLIYFLNKKGIRFSSFKKCLYSFAALAVHSRVVPRRFMQLYRLFITYFSVSSLGLFKM